MPHTEDDLLRASGCNEADDSATIPSDLVMEDPEPCQQEIADLSNDAGRNLTGHEATLYRVRKLHASIIRDMLGEKP